MRLIVEIIEPPNLAGRLDRELGNNSRRGWGWMTEKSQKTTWVTLLELLDHCIAEQVGGRSETVLRLGQLPCSKSVLATPRRKPDRVAIRCEGHR